MSIIEEGIDDDNDWHWQLTNDRISESSQRDDIVKKLLLIDSDIDERMMMTYDD